MPGQSTSEIVIGANGKVLVAPVGTVAPVDIATAWAAAWVDLGFLSEDGVSFSNSRTTERVNVWQMFNAARYFVTEEETTASFTLRQWSRVTVPLAFGGGTITTTAGPPAHYMYEPPTAGTIDERAVGIEWVDGTKIYRLILKKVMVTDAVETSFTKSGPADLPISLGVMGVDGAVPWYLRSNDPSFAAA